MKNRLIKEALASHNMFQYQLADLLGVNEGTVCRKLRHELPTKEQERIVKIIENASEMKAGD